jgi:hypothetical protein
MSQNEWILYMKYKKDHNSINIFKKYNKNKTLDDIWNVAMLDIKKFINSDPYAKMNDKEWEKIKIQKYRIVEPDDKNYSYKFEKPEQNVEDNTIVTLYCDLDGLEFFLFKGIYEDAVNDNNIKIKDYKPIEEKYVFVIYNLSSDKILTFLEKDDAKKYFKDNDEEFKISKMKDNRFVENTDSFLKCVKFFTTNNKIFLSKWIENGNGVNELYITINETKEEAIFDLMNYFSSQHDHDEEDEENEKFCEPEFEKLLNSDMFARMKDSYEEFVYGTIMHISINNHKKRFKSIDYEPPLEEIDNFPQNKQQMSKYILHIQSLENKNNFLDSFPLSTLQHIFFSQLEENINRNQVRYSSRNYLKSEILILVKNELNRGNYNAEDYPIFYLIHGLIMKNNWELLDLEGKKIIAILYNVKSNYKNVFQKQAEIIKQIDEDEELREEHRSTFGKSMLIGLY